MRIGNPLPTSVRRPSNLRAMQAARRAAHIVVGRRSWVGGNKTPICWAPPHQSATLIIGVAHLLRRVSSRSSIATEVALTSFTSRGATCAWLSSPRHDMVSEQTAKAPGVAHDLSQISQCKSMSPLIYLTGGGRGWRPSTRKSGPAPPPSEAQQEGPRQESRRSGQPRWHAPLCSTRKASDSSLWISGSNLVSAPHR